MDIQDLLEKFGKRPQAQRWATLAVVQVLLIAAFWMLVYSPTQQELTTLRSQHNELNAKRAQVKQRSENKKKFQADLDSLNSALNIALRELPNDSEIPELLTRISSVGKKVGLEVRRFQPLPEVSREYYADIPIALEMVGSFHDVAMFFDKLSKLNRIVYVKDLMMEEFEERNGRPMLRVEGRAVSFRFLTEEEISAKAAKSKSKKKRGKKR